MSNVTKAIKIAIKKGFSINDKGNVFRHSKLIKPCFHKGYAHFSVVISPNKQISVSFHRFQGYRKFGLRIFRQKIQIRHLDSNKLNNAWDNIGIGTSLDNARDIPKDIRIQTAKTASRARWGKESDAASMLKDYENGMHWRGISKKYGTSRSNTHRLLSKQNNLKSL